MYFSIGDITRSRYWLSFELKRHVAKHERKITLSTRSTYVGTSRGLFVLFPHVVIVGHVRPNKPIFPHE